MYAIVESGGMQFKVEKDSRVFIPKLDAEPGTEVRLDRVLALNDGDNLHVGSPYVKEAQVKARVLVHARHEKLVVYKYKKRKNYRRKRGHRQDYSEVLITEILTPKALRKEAEPEVLKKEAAPKVSKQKGAPREAKKKTPVKKVRKKPAPAAATKKAKSTRVKAKPVRKKKVAKKTPTRRKTAAKPVARTKKKTGRRVIGRLRKKKKEE